MARYTGDIIEILEAFDLTGSLRDAARLAGCSPMTVARYVRLRETGRLPTGRSARRDQVLDPGEGADLRKRAPLAPDRRRAEIRSRLRWRWTSAKKSG